MATVHTPRQQVRQARLIAEAHGMYIVEKSTPQSLIFQVYRKVGNAYLGRRTSAGGIFHLVNKLATVH